MRRPERAVFWYTEFRTRMAKKQSKKASAAWFILGQEISHWLLISGVALSVVVMSGTSSQIGGIGRQSVTVWSLLASVAVATLVLLWLIRSKVGPKIFGALFALAVFSGIFTAVSVFFGLGAAVIVLAAAILLYYNNPPVAVFDLILSLGMGGIAASIGFGFRPAALLIVLVVLSAYDIAAVYLTGHMVKLGKALLRRKVFFAMILPESPKGLLRRIGEVAPGEGFMFLGTGDFVLPALLVASVAAAGGPWAALPVAAGAGIGLAATHAIFISQRIRRPMAALPPIAAGAAIGYVFSVLIA